MKKQANLKRTLIPIALIIAVTAVIIGIKLRRPTLPGSPPVFAEKTMIEALWQSSKDTFWEASTGRTLDPQRNYITTSEGQSYTLLRAVWMDDQKTFDTAWTWTQQQLGRKDDALFSWLWGKKSDQSYGVLTDLQGQNAASDADGDMAMALVFASLRWQDDTYLAQARKIINDIWEREVVTVNGVPYLAANNLEKSSKQDEIIINPSYFSPYQYRMFAEIDPNAKHEWMRLVDSSYELLNASMDGKLDVPKSAEIPPNWIVMNKKTGEMIVKSGYDSNFGYDALRIPWRISLDALWYKDERAKKFLERLHFFQNEWDSNEKIFAVYSHAGVPTAHEENPAMYGGLIGFFMVTNPETAKEIYTKKLEPLFDRDGQKWKDGTTYYDDNWAWFGMALYNNNLENIFEALKS